MTKDHQEIRLSSTFKVPAIILAGIVIYLLLNYFGQQTAGMIVIFATIALGSYGLFRGMIISILKRHYALDYIAFLAIIVSIFANEYLVAAIIALMITSGRTLEEYGVSRAKKSLTKLIDRIPDEVILLEEGKTGKKEKIANVKVGQEVLIRKGEVIALDGILVSESGLTDESSLTGEPYMIDKIKGDQIRSGTINVGNPIVIRITKTEADSTYTAIINMVKESQEEKAPLVRLADRYSTIFTIVTLAIAAFAYLYTGKMINTLAVLVIATPCPLILATPIALMGGVNAAAKKRIIVKKLSSLEALSRVTTIIFDKTGTITLGVPRLEEIKLLKKQYDEKTVLGIAEAIERNSLHPLAKAIVAHAKEKDAPIMHATNVTEEVGTGITGTVNGEKYKLSKLPEGEGMAIVLTHNEESLAILLFEDEIKQESRQVIKDLKKSGYELFIFTGDKKASAERVISQIGEDVVIKAELKPEDKQEGVKELRRQGKIIAMVGDGINDAPALAIADVGLVFSNEERTAASEAADIVFLGGDFLLVHESLMISKRTVHIALQSILWGIGISIVGMILAALGYIPPILGAVIQEVLDVAVIINALRASR